MCGDGIIKLLNQDMERSAFMTLHEAVPLMPESPFQSPITWTIGNDEVWGVTGGNGSGKSLLGDLLCGKIAVKSGIVRYHFLNKAHQSSYAVWQGKHVRKVDFKAAYTLGDFRHAFYQQRFHQSENEEMPEVRDLLPPEGLNEEMRLIFDIFDIPELFDRKLSHLSSGELRKFLVARSFAGQPAMLIFDNPFIGLDEASREELNNLFAFLLRHYPTRLLFLAPSPADLPRCITHIVEMNRCRIRYAGTLDGFAPENAADKNMLPDIHWNHFDQRTIPPKGAELVSLSKVDIVYDKRIIQKNLHWQIKKGEKWALLGPNGSGKSTLLSYIFADNPQAYAKDIRLFGRKRGTGESIWDIKRQVGFTSWEMHFYYRKNIPCHAVVSSGFFDSIGLFRQCTGEQSQLADKILDLLRIGHLKNRPFLKISSGEQRLVLFARAIVKNPLLLILDEPFHGLDEHNKRQCTAIIESFAHQKDKALIYVTHIREEIPRCVTHFMRLEAL